MSNNKLIYILVGSIFIIIMFYIYGVNNKPINTEQSILHKIDSLNNISNKELIIRDSLKTVIDTNTVTIKEIHKTYEKNINTILHQSISADWKFLTDYLSRYDIDSTGLKKVESDSNSAQ